MGIYKHSWGNAPWAPHGEHSWKMSSLHKTARFFNGSVCVCVFKINEMFLQPSKSGGCMVVILVYALGVKYPIKTRTTDWIATRYALYKHVIISM